MSDRASSRSSPQTEEATQMEDKRPVWALGAPEGRVVLAKTRLSSTCEQRVCAGSTLQKPGEHSAETLGSENRARRPTAPSLRSTSLVVGHYPGTPHSASGDCCPTLPAWGKRSMCPWCVLFPTRSRSQSHGLLCQRGWRLCPPTKNESGLSVTRASRHCLIDLVFEKSGGASVMIAHMTTLVIKAFATAKTPLYFSVSRLPGVLRVGLDPLSCFDVTALTWPR